MKFYRFLMVAVALVVSSNAYAQRERKLYVGSNSTEAVMTYRGEVQISSATKPTAGEVNDAITSQVQHLFGTMTAATTKAVPKGDHDITGKTVPKKVADGVWSVSYNYRDMIVLENRKPDSKTYNIIVPVNPGAVFQAAMDGNHNPCTDEHYQSEGDFWYFWNPDQAGCKLKKGTDYVVIPANVARQPNTKVSYPEYKRLVDKNNEVVAYVFFGLDEADHGHNPITSSDINAQNFRVIRNHIINQGYSKKKWTDAQVQAVAKGAEGAMPYVEDLTKDVNGVKLVLRFYFGETGITENSTAFHWFYKDALENSSIMIYGGHSGLGGHLDLRSIEDNLTNANGGETVTIRPNKSRYQIYFFDSCSSYSYYNKDYFGRKVTDRDPKGTKNLDIFTNGLATMFGSMPNSTNKTIEAVETALEYAFKGEQLVTYQTLAKAIDDDNLFGINGDEDNPPPAGK
jgi:hypothetical protein